MDLVLQRVGDSEFIRRIDTGGQHRSVYFAERMAERLSGIEDVEIEVVHAAMQCLRLEEFNDSQ